MGLRSPLRSSTLFFSVFVIHLSLINPVSALPAPSSFLNWLTSTVLPQPGTTISDEIKCYGLPYGTIGNVSHFLTYWTLGCIFFYRAPWWPWRSLRAGKLDLSLGIIQVVVSVGVASLTIARCRNRWQFIVLAAARLQFSLTLGYAAIHTSLRVMYTVRNEYERLGKIRAEKLSMLPWLVHLAALPGIAAIVSLVHGLWNSCQCESKDSCQVCGGWLFSGHHPTVQVISWVFLGCLDLLLLVLVFCLGKAYGYRQLDQGQSKMHHFHIVLGTLSMMLALYTDWLLAVIADNVTGAPGGDIALLYWAYFSAKRLPMLFS